MNQKDIIVDELTKKIQNFSYEPGMEKVGNIIEVGDGIARIYGLNDVASLEMLEFPGGVMGIALNLEEDNVGAMILGDYTHIKEGDIVKSTGKLLSVPVGDELVGRVVNPLGLPIDNKGDLGTTKTGLV